MRSTLTGDKIDVSDVERTLNEWAARRWHVRSLTETSGSGRLGPDGTMDLIVVFERETVDPKGYKNPNRSSWRYLEGLDELEPRCSCVNMRSSD